MATIHYRSEDGIIGYAEGDILIDDTTGRRSRVVRDGRGLCLEPIIGRPPIPLEQRRDVKIVSVRVEGNARREKLRRLGRAWLERAIDEADDTHRGDSAAPPPAAD